MKHFNLEVEDKKNLTKENYIENIVFEDKQELKEILQVYDENIEKLLEIYWEHFGRMDDPVYAKSAGAKLQQYFVNGIIPGEQLIITFETKENPLSIETIESVVQEYFK